MADLESWIRREKVQMGAGQVAYGTNFLPDMRCLYVETPKVACSTIKGSLQAIVARDQARDFGNVHQRRNSPLLSFADVPDVDAALAHPGLFRFCFVRHPYTRTLSAWKDKIAGGPSRQRRAFLKTMGQDPDSEAEIPFEAFLEVLQEQKPKQMNPHWRPQAAQVMLGAVTYDFIGRFERFDADFAYALGRAGGDVVETIRPHSTGAAADQPELTPRARQLIQAIFAADFTAFGYAP
ncbi:sulfotransferase family protein [Pseudoruegeria sp. SHC-113]|uniref:sulfotransferase family protein n=1 Tax=Pseudoruegeria sp. SHC-113 TaxID=2855439 RepID=UPI0021BBAE4D|nr:sulfotransferase family protein [Pseudoruegeria sp. SHC-113]MCT8159747.1 sulfotransferase family protein [Pseudoruegeria sp. SHC-113]